MKPKQTLAEAHAQLFGSIRSLAAQLIANAYSRYKPDEEDFSIELALEKEPEPNTVAGKKVDAAYTPKVIPTLSRLGDAPRLPLRETCSIKYAKAEQNFLEALQAYAEVLVYDAYSRYDLDEKAFFTREAYEEIMEALEDDEGIPMEQVAAELGLKWYN